MKAKNKNTIILIGTVINYLILIASAFYTGGFAMINIVDFEGAEYSSTLCSTLLFLTTCIWIAVAAKHKAKASLGVSAGVMFLSSIAYLGIGLFQPFWYVPLSLLSMIFGGEFFSLNPFAGIENSGVVAVFCLLLCVLDKATHICLGAVALKYYGKCKAENGMAKKN